MKRVSLGVISAATIAAAVAAACGGGSSGDVEPQAAAVPTTAQPAALENRHTTGASPVDPEPRGAAGVATKPVRATGGTRVQVVGIAGSARGRLAMVAIGTAAPVLLKEGDSIEGETLLRIGVDYIVLGRLGLSRTIRVGVDKASEAATATSAPSVVNSPADARSSLASNRAFEQMLSQRERRDSP